MGATSCPLSARHADASNASIAYARCVKDIGTVPRTELDVRDLRLVLALARAGTTAKASRVLHVTQPAVSRALLALEEKLGARLFDRTQRGLVLTPAGERLHAGATSVLVELGELEAVVRSPVPPPCRLRVVCECYTAYHWLPSTLVSLRRAMPELTIDLAIEHTAAPVAGLEVGAIDVALLTTSAISRGLVERPLFSDEIVFVVGEGHPLARRKVLTRADLRAHPLITSPTPPTESRWFVQRVFGRARPSLRVDRVPLTEAMMDLARAGLGIAVLSEWIAAPHLARGGLVRKRLEGRPLERPWRLAWRPEQQHAAERLLGVLQASVPHLAAIG